MKTMKKILCALLVVVMCLTSAPLGGFELTAEAADYKVGDIIQFGSYPQSEVKDNATINALNKLAPEWDEWTSYGYYSGTRSTGISGSTGTMKQGDWMRYVDIKHNGNKYRGVKFIQYRPCYTDYRSSTNNTHQYGNGYCANTVYWFKFEPIDWRVLDPATGLVMCETIIDSQPYSNTNYDNVNESDWRYANFNDVSYTNYASDYETSSIRKWLNNDFYNTAFTDSEKKEINTTTLNNDGYYTSVGTTGYEKLDSNSTNDKIFLLSYNEVRNSNLGFNSSASAYDPARFAQGSDYAQSQGIYIHRSLGDSYNNNSPWLLRSPGCQSIYCCSVDVCGYSVYYSCVDGSMCGVRPALCFNLDKIGDLDEPVNPDEPDIPEKPTEPNVPDIPTEPEETKSIAILTTNKSFCIEPDDSMWVAFGIMREDGMLEDNWRKMAISVSDPTIVSLSEYKETEYGYSLEIKGKKEGSTNIVVTDTETGMNEVFKVTVCDDFSKSSSFSIETPYAFYPSNKHESDILTNIYDMNGLYVNNYKCVKTSDGYDVTFDVYNQRYHIGAVDVFDKNGNWIESVEIEKYSDITSLYDTGEEIFYLVKDWLEDKLLTYEMESFSKHTPVKISVPEGGYFTVSNNYAESIGTFFFNSAEIFYEGVSAAIDLIAGNIDSEPFVDLILKKFDETPTLKKAFQDIFTSSLDKEIRDISQNILKGNAENAYLTIAGLFENILSAYKIEWKHLFQIASGVGEGAFNKFSGPVGLALQGCFALTGYTNKILNARHIATSINETSATFYSNTDEGFVNPNGIYVTDNGNVDAEAVLQVFRISNDDSISVLLDSADPLAMHELYNICFVKNDKLVQPNGKVKVHIPVPKNMKGNTCTVYRQEDDGSWTVLKARKEGDYLVFETDHFSLYAIIGIRNELEINTLPDKLTYESNDKLELSGLTLKMNGEIVEEGFICNPSVMFETGKQTITVNYMGLTTEFEVTVEPHKHVLDKNGKCQKCGEDVTKNCSCNCHAGGIKKFFFKFLLFFQKIFKKNKTCKCGVGHY